MHKDVGLCIPGNLSKQLMCSTDLGCCWAQVAPLWFLAQFTFNTSLHLTSVTSNTILSSTASLFTYGLSWAVIQEPFVAHKLVSIIVCAAGITITISNNNNNYNYK